MKENELKPCPFCGGKAEFKSSVNCWGHGEYIKEHYVMCTECFAHGRTESEYGMEADECIAKCKESWNRRVNNEWISVDDRLPERNGRYLTHCKIEGQSLVCALFYCKIGGFNESTVTHWMPLPEPPVMERGAV